MGKTKRLVSKLPVDRLWRDGAELADAVCIGTIGRADVKELLQRGSVWIAIADVGLPLRWIEPPMCRDFFAREVAGRLADLDEIVGDDPFPGGYVYLAQRWSIGQGDVIVFQRYD